MKHMELHQLKLFLDLVREGSFTRVAEMNRLTQPAVSLQIQRLEADLGCKLLERTTRRVLVTEEGRILAAYARDIIALSQEAQQALLERRGQMVGSLRVAAIHSVGLYELPDYLKRYIHLYPDVHLHIEYHRSELVYQLVLQGSVDVGLVAYPEPRDSMVVIPFLEDEMVVIVNPERRRRRFLAGIERAGDDRLRRQHSHPPGHRLRAGAGRRSRERQDGVRQR